MRRERIALVWDMGAGFGHVTKLTALADAYASQGHEPIVVARNLRSFLAQWGGPRHALVSAPHNDWFVDDDPPIHYADLLWSECGFHDVLQLEALARAWRSLFHELRIDRLIVEGAPLAVFASAGLGLPRTVIGNGFLLPPPGPPWPLLRACAADTVARLQQRDHALQANAAVVQSRLGAQPVSLQEALAAEANALVTYAAFDPYGPRTLADTRYFAPAPGTGMALPDELCDKSFVFAYLQREDARTAGVLDALDASGIDALVVMAGAPDSTRGRITIRGRACDASVALAQARCVICHGGNLAQQAAAAGLPVLTLPLQYEQLCTGRMVEARHAGLMVGEDRGAAAVERVVDQLIHDAGMADAARAFGVELRRSGAMPFNALPEFALAAVSGRLRS